MATLHVGPGPIFAAARLEFDPFWANDSKVMANVALDVVKRNRIRRGCATVLDFGRQTFRIHVYPEVDDRHSIHALSPPVREPRRPVRPKTAQDLPQNAKMAFTPAHIRPAMRDEI